MKERVLGYLSARATHFGHLGEAAVGNKRQREKYRAIENELRRCVRHVKSRAFGAEVST